MTSNENSAVTEEVTADLPRLLSLRRSLIQRFLHERPDVVVGIDVPDFNLGLTKQLKARRTAHRSVREPAGVGVASGAGEDHRPVRGSRAVPAALRDRVLRTARRARRVRGPSAGGSDSPGDRSCGGAGGRWGWTRRRGRGAVAGQPHGRGRAARRRISSQAAAWIAARRPDCKVRRANGFAQGARVFRESARGSRGRPGDRCAGRPGAAGAGCCGWRDRCVGHRDTRDHTFEAADGGGLPAGRHYGVSAEATGAGEGAVFFAT